jgi:hypothetical protein
MTVHAGSQSSALQLAAHDVQVRLFGDMLVHAATIFTHPGGRPGRYCSRRTFPFSFRAQASAGSIRAARRAGRDEATSAVSRSSRRAQHAAEAESRVVHHVPEYRPSRTSIVRYTLRRDVAATE